MLSVTIKKFWFQEILAGRKRVEYRSHNAWFKRRIDKDPTQIVLLCGTSSAKFRVRKIELIDGHPFKGKGKCYAIYLGQKLKQHGKMDN